MDSLSLGGKCIHLFKVNWWLLINQVKQVRSERKFLFLHVVLWWTFIFLHIFIRHFKPISTQIGVEVILKYYYKSYNTICRNWVWVIIKLVVDDTTLTLFVVFSNLYIVCLNTSIREQYWFKFTQLDRRNKSHLQLLFIIVCDIVFKYFNQSTLSGIYIRLA